MAEVIVPAREARTMEVKKGQTLEIVDLEGQQVGDFTAWLASDPDEYLSPSHTVSSNGKLVPEVGDSILSNHRTPLFRILRDDVGRHDLVVPCCDPERYSIDYDDPDHGSCLLSLETAIEGLGLPLRGEMCWNVFMNNQIEDGKIVTYEPPHPAGSTIAMEVLEDMTVALSVMSAGHLRGKCLQPDPDGAEDDRLKVNAAPRTSATEVAEAARIISGAGLVEGFGHVSARGEEGFLITATLPLGAATSAQIHEVDAAGEAVQGAEDVPLETPMHAAVYAARPDVNAICRTHSPAAVRAGAAGEVPPLTHGLGGLAGEVKISGRTDLVTDRAAGEEIAEDLGDANCLLIRGNGSIATGRNLAEATVRARYLEERCLVSEGFAPADGWRADLLEPRARWFEKETTRAWAWLRWRYGGEA